VFRPLANAMAETDAPGLQVSSTNLRLNSTGNRRRATFGADGAIESSIDVRFQKINGHLFGLRREAQSMIYEEATGNTVQTARLHLINTCDSVVLHRQRIRKFARHAIRQYLPQNFIFMNGSVCVMIALWRLGKAAIKVSDEGGRIPISSVFGVDATQPQLVY